MPPSTGASSAPDFTFPPQLTQDIISYPSLLRPADKASFLAPSLPLPFPTFPPLPPPSAYSLHLPPLSPRRPSSTDHFEKENCLDIEAFKSALLARSKTYPASAFWLFPPLASGTHCRKLLHPHNVRLRPTNRHPHSALRRIPTPSPPHPRLPRILLPRTHSSPLQRITAQGRLPRNPPRSHRRARPRRRAFLRHRARCSLPWLRRRPGRSWRRPWLLCRSPQQRSY